MNSWSVFHEKSNFHLKFNTKLVTGQLTDLLYIRRPQDEAILKYGYIMPREGFESTFILLALLLLLLLSRRRYQIDQVSR
jgi:hypothetical protein